MTSIDRAREKSRLVLNRWVDSMSKMPEGIAIIEIECLKTMLTAAFREYESEAERLRECVDYWKQESLKYQERHAETWVALRNLLSSEALKEAPFYSYSEAIASALEVLARHRELLERIGALKP